MFGQREGIIAVKGHVTLTENYLSEWRAGKPKSTVDLTVLFCVDGLTLRIYFLGWIVTLSASALMLRCGWKFKRII